MAVFFNLTDVIPPLNREESLSYFAKLFGNKNPLVVELGSGNGHFLVEYAALNTDINFIGTEILIGRAKKFSKKAEKKRLNNVAIFRGDSRRFVWDFIYEETVSEFIILFPDPWPKKRHHKHRLLTRKFIRMLFLRLVPGGKVSLATDYEEYRDFIIEEFTYVEGFKTRFKERYSEYPDNYPLSLYQEKLRNEGKRLYYMQYMKE
jgi:tRNA (guanine-N7-)-methyltransferase